MMSNKHDSVAGFLEEWVNLRPVTFFEIQCKVSKARENCHKELKQLEKRRLLTVEPVRIGSRKIPVYQLRRHGVESEESRIKAIGLLTRD